MTAETLLKVPYFLEKNICRLLSNIRCCTAVLAYNNFKNGTGGQNLVKTVW